MEIIFKEQNLERIYIFCDLIYFRYDKSVEIKKIVK